MRRAPLLLSSPFVCLIPALRGPVNYKQIRSNRQTIGAEGALGSIPPRKYQTFDIRQNCSGADSVRWSVSCIIDSG